MEGEGHPDFGSLLRQYRLAARLSQEALAERARLSLNGISALERGYRRTPQRETLALLAGALALDENQRKEFETAAARTSLPRRRAAGSVTVGPWAETEATPLPFALTTFVGRQCDLDEIAALVRENRLVTLTGAGGVGKTQTALHVATTTDAANSGAICFVGLAPIADSALVLTEIASALGVQEVPNRPLRETLSAFLKNKSLLLILDNCEHVVEEAATAVDALLLSCPRVRILATSREPLRTAGERTYRLPSLNLNDARALFADRARAADDRFHLTDETSAVVGELCRRLDGIPLAIELAAARVKILSPRALVEKLDDRFSILAGGKRLALPRQKTMRATIDWSYSLLSVPEQRLFERLSIFAGACGFTEITAVCAGDDLLESDVLDLLSSLVDKSLVTVVHYADEPHYMLLESFREYGREKLEARGEQATVAHRHARAYLAMFGRARRLGHGEYAKLDLSPVVPNVRTALRWALTERGDAPLGQELTCLCLRAFSYAEGVRWMATALDLISDETPITLLAPLHLMAADINGNERRFTAELASAQRALGYYRSLSDAGGTVATAPWFPTWCYCGMDPAEGIVKAQFGISHALFFLGRRAEAKILAEKNVSLARQLDRNRRDRLIAGNLEWLAIATYNDIDAARGYLAEAMQIGKTLNLEPYNVARMLLDLSECEFGAGNAELALLHAREALNTLAAAPRNVAVEDYQSCAFNEIALYLISLGRYDEAEGYARRTLDLAREYGLHFDMLWSLEHFAAVAALRPRSVPSNSVRACSAARLLGFADARLAERESERLPFAQLQYDRTLTELQRSLGGDRVSQLMSEGAAMTEEQAVEEALGR